MVLIWDHCTLINPKTGPLPGGVTSLHNFWFSTSTLFITHILKYAPHSAVTEEHYFKKREIDVSLNLSNWIIISVKELHLCDKMCFGREMVMPWVIAAFYSLEETYHWKFILWLNYSSRKFYELKKEHSYVFVNRFCGANQKWLHAMVRCYDFTLYCVCAPVL